MRFAHVLLFPVLLCFVICAYAQDADTPPGLIQFGEEGRPQVVAWAAEGETEPFVSWLNDDNSEAAIQAGKGCLVLLKSDSLPIFEATEVEAGSTRSVTDLEWKEGPSFFGLVVDSGDIPVPAVVRFAETATPKDTTEQLCREALAAADFYEVRASSSGHFESQPVHPGRYALTVEAPDYATVERVLVIDGKQPEKDVGIITIHAVARVDVVVDASDIDANPPFELVVESENPTAVFQADKWENPIEVEVEPDVPVQVVTKPGRHRLTLTKTGSDLKYTTFETYSPGWQESHLHPEPIYLEGKVTTDDHPVENAKVWVATSDFENTTHTDKHGFYEMTLWVRAQFGATATSPSGDSQLLVIDLRETEPGELVEKDFNLSTGKISGRVVAASDQSPLEGCYVGLRMFSTKVSSTDKGGVGRGVTTSADGTFLFHGIWDEADSVTLLTHMEGYLPREVDVAFVGEDVRDIWIELDELGSTFGRVVGPTGSPLAGIDVLHFPPGIGAMYTARTVTGHDGSFSANVHPGEVLFAKAAGYAIGWAAARDNEETVIGLQGLSAPTRVRVQTENGAPAAGVHITYASDSGVVLPFFLIHHHTLQNGLSRVTDPEGIIDVASLPPGVYQVLMAGRSGVVNLGTLPIPSSGQVTLQVPEKKRMRDDNQKAEATRGSRDGGGKKLHPKTGTVLDAS